MRIMLIDDEKTVIKSIQKSLKPSGHECVLFESPHDAIAEYKKTPYDIVVTDYKMPGMNGIEVLKEIRMHDPHARVIILTGYADINNAIAAVNNGAYAFFRKPLDFSDFMDTIGIVQKQTESASGLDVDGPLLKERYAELKQAYTKLLWVVKDLDSELKQNEESEKTVRNGGEKKT